ncbi:hypothetical protein BGI06_10635, partial [Snodgrassella alvi]
ICIKYIKYFKIEQKYICNFSIYSLAFKIYDLNVKHLEWISMSNVEEFYKKHRAGAQDAAQSYHSYYLLLLLLRLRIGEKIGFEVKEDLHITKADGTTEYIQIKHSTQRDAQRNPVNLTSLDMDLWGTLSNWLTLIQSDNFKNLDKCKFTLITNKEGRENKFQNVLIDFKSEKDKDTEIFLNQISSIPTNNQQILECIKQFKQLSQNDLRLFLNNLSIETGNNDVIKKIREEIFYKCMDEKYIQTIFDSFCSRLQEKKYNEICNKGSYEISYDNYLKDFGDCIRAIYKHSPLPVREWNNELPNDLESQIFIQQLLDIEDIDQDSKEKIREFTFKKLSTVNTLSDWIENKEIYQFDLENFEKNTIELWKNYFGSKYRAIRRKINNGDLISDLEDEIKPLAVEMLDDLRKISLSVPGNLYLVDIFISNGYLYLLSDKLKIGWHYDWKNRYTNL